MKKALAVLVLLTSSAWAQPPQSPKIAALVGLFPPESYVHVFCDIHGGLGNCAVTFRCQGYFDEVMWTVDVPPGLFKYWPGQTDTTGNKLDLETALVDAGLSERDARHRTACAVHSFDPVDVQAFSYLAGHLVPMSNQVGRGDPDAGPFPMDPHPLDPDPDPSSPNHVPPPTVVRADVLECTPSAPLTRCRLTYKVLVWFEWDVRHHAWHDLYRSTDRSGRNLNHVSQDGRIATLQSVQAGEFTRISGAEDPIPENGQTYYYWVSLSTGIHGSKSDLVGPVEVEIPAQ